MRHIIVFSVALVFTSPVSSHHSDAGLDMASVVTFEGSVTEFTWRNPHIYFTVEARDGSGQQVEWIVQMGSTNTVTSMGWTRESLLIGDLVTVGVHAAHSGRPFGLLDSIERYTRTNFATLEKITTIIDPGAYEKPFTIQFDASLRPRWDLIEYICNENNQDVEHIRGSPSG